MIDKYECNFKIEGTDKRALVTCEDCGKENYAINVLSGICAWCVYDINKKNND